jgi:hypothetical protein
VITVTHDEFEVVLRKPTVRDDLNAQIMRRRLEEAAPDGAQGYWALFAQICSQAAHFKGLPFDPASLAGTNGNTLETAYEQFLDLPKAFKDKAVRALNDLERPIDEALSKDAAKSADPK